MSDSKHQPEANDAGYWSLFSAWVSTLAPRTILPATLEVSIDRTDRPSSEEQETGLQRVRPIAESLLRGCGHGDRENQEGHWSTA